MSSPTVITAPTGQPTMVTEREFDAPVERVFQANVNADLYAQWIGAMPGTVTTIEQFDARSGGSYHWSQSGDGFEFSFRGVFHTVQPNEILIQTFEYSGAPNQVGVSLATFTDLGDGRSRLVVRDTYPSVEARDAAVASGMEEGMRLCYEALERLASGADVSSAG